MVKISTKQAYELLIHASGFIGENGFFEPSFSFWHDHPDHIWLTLEDETEECRYEFTEEEQVVDIAICSVFIKDINGDTVQITPVFTENLEDKINLQS
jgi:hypothetical protein